MWCPGEGGGRGRCVTSPPSVLSWGLGVVSLLVSSNKTDLSKKKKLLLRLWTGRRQKLADCGRPHASCGKALFCFLLK